MTAIALIVAAGRGERVASETGDRTPKQYLRVAGVPILRRTVERFLAHPGIARVQVVINPGHRDLYEQAVTGLTERLSWVAGGAERQSSVRAGLRALRAHQPDHVLIHDGVRPFFTSALVDRVLRGLKSQDAVIPVLAGYDSVKRIENGIVKETIERRGLVFAQTPQGFRYSSILEAHSRAAVENIEGFTDDAEVAQWAGMPVHLVKGEVENVKITTPDDVEMAHRRMLMEQMLEIGDVRTGHGFDVHAFGPGDHIMLCGVSVPSDKGLVGHSDADVGLHALTDALLGAIGAGDIGAFFPPDDPQLKGASSDRFLRHAAEMVRARKGRISNVDVTLICESPKVAPHRQAMCQAISSILSIPAERVSVKATTTEGLGFTGRREGIAAQATATVCLPVTG